MGSRLVPDPVADPADRMLAGVHGAVLYRPPTPLQRATEKQSPRISVGWGGDDGSAGLFPCIALCATRGSRQRAAASRSRCALAES